jgi:hypothetical protein
MLLIGTIDEQRLTHFVQRIEKQLGKEITYTPLTENEYKYRRNFNDMFLRSIFIHPYKELFNKLDEQLQPDVLSRKVRAITRGGGITI